MEAVGSTVQNNSKIKYLTGRIYKCTDIALYIKAHHNVHKKTKIEHEEKMSEPKHNVKHKQAEQTALKESPNIHEGGEKSH